MEITTDISIDNTNSIIKNSIVYLNNISKDIPSNYPALESYYSLKRRLYELRSKIFLPNLASSASLICNHCFIYYRQGDNNVKCIPENKPSAFARKVLKKNEHAEPLTKYQRKYLKKIKKYAANTNQLEITCLFCKHKNKVAMEKQFKKSMITDIIDIYKIRNINRNKKKKKDKFCGLEKTAVLAAAPKNAKINKLPNFIPLKSNNNNNKKTKKKSGVIKKSNKSPKNQLPKSKILLSKAKLTKNKKDKKSKLNDILNKQVDTNNSSKKLKHFLQSL